MKASAKTKDIFSEVLKRIKPSHEELGEISKSLNEFLARLEHNKKKFKIDAQIFVGGSFAKKTLIKKEDYDIDIFIRFSKKYPDKNLSNLTGKILRGFKADRIHGSRDYFKVRPQGNKKVFFEIVPVRKVSGPKDAVNITDLSYYHVRYVRKKINREKTLDDIMLAKAFCNACKCYGAESYIHGFSGYGLELLVYNYKSFMNFVRAMARAKEGKIVIDLEKYHKNKSHILMDLNSAKLEAPIVLIDPTHKTRNVLAALSEKTFRKFQKHCKDFLKNPSIRFFEIQKADIKDWKREAKKKRSEFFEFSSRTRRQSGDIAGSKLLKFYGLLKREIERFFEIKRAEFEYPGHGTSAKYLFIAKPKKEIWVSGPKTNNSKHAKRFRMKHKKVSVKKGRLYAKIKTEKNLKKFLTGWKKKNGKVMKDMGINYLGR